MEWYLIEMVLNVPFSQINWGGIVVPEEGMNVTDWQCPYMEQYLNADGTEKICETYDDPAEDVCPCRVAFFLCKIGSGLLRTPYGDFPLGGTDEVPPRLKNIIEFEND